MGKVFNSMILGVGITVALWIFNGNGFDSTSLLFLLLNAPSWQTSAFWTSLTAVAISTSVITIGIGALLKQDWLVRGGMVASLSTITLFPYIALFTFLAGQTAYTSACVASIGTTGTSICTQLNAIGGIGQIIALVFAGPLFLYALWALIEFIWKGDH